MIDMKDRQSYTQRIRLKLLLLIVLLISIVFLQDLPAQTKNSLVVAWEQWEPYKYQDEHNKVTGLDIELARLILNNAGYDIVFIKMPWVRQMYSIEKGELVNIATGADYSKDRSRWAYFSNPYRSIKVVIFTLKGTLKKYPYNSLKEILNHNFRLGVSRGVYYGKQYTALIKEPGISKNIQAVSEEKQNLIKLLYGRIDGFLEEIVSGLHLVRKHKALDKIDIHPVIVHTSDQYFMFSKKTVKPEVVDKINKSMTELKAAGAIDKIINKYIKTESLK